MNVLWDRWLIQNGHFFKIKMLVVRKENETFDGQMACTKFMFFQK